MKRSLKIAPSILAADYARLGEAVSAIDATGADQIHIDVLDGVFAPNISFGPGVVKSVRPYSKLPFDVHLMIAEPDRYLEAFAEAGADMLTVHVEAGPHIHRTLQHIRVLGLRAGVTLNPGTPVVALSEVAADADFVLVMSVNPGFGGQAFIESSLRKVEATRRLLNELGNTQADLSVDGGVDETNAARIVAAGANVLVAGTAIFGASDGLGAAVQRLRRAGHSLTA
jgi:ribulose-phosphate 3-epimerase